MKRITVIGGVLFVFIFSCKESVTNRPESDNTGAISVEAKIDSIVVADTVLDGALASYLKISAVDEVWPSKSVGLKEINWQKDMTSPRHSRHYYPLDTLIEGRPVFADSLKEQFFFYLPFNYCWILHSEFPSESELFYLKENLGVNFDEVTRREDYYRCGFEYGKSDSWKLENIVFSKNPWKCSETYGSTANSGIEKTSMYQLTWVGQDPMPEMKENWEKKYKTKRYEEWTAAYDEYIMSADNFTLFVPKPIDIDYKNTLQGYFEDLYKIVDTVSKTYDVKLTKSEFEPIMDYYGFTTINEAGDTMISPSFAHGLEMKVSFKSEDDTLVFPWPLETEVQYGEGISYHESVVSFELIMGEKMAEEEQYFTFLEEVNTKYFFILLEFLYGETYVVREIDGNKEYWERLYTMPSKNEIERELGCIFNIQPKGISFFCDPGGC